MKFQRLIQNEPQEFALIFDKGDEFINVLSEFAKNNKLGGIPCTAIGAFSEVTLGYFDRQQKHYQKIPIKEQVEVLSLVGDIAMTDGMPSVHAHSVVGRSDGTAHGGHLEAGHVCPPLEVVLSESPSPLCRKTDEETGLALIDLSRRA